jgi:hypothetical protein
VSVAATLVAGLAVVLALPLAWRALTRSFDPFEPVVLFAVAYGVMFVARPTVMLIEGDLSYGVDVRETFPAAMALAFAGGVAFLVGYHLRGGVALARRLPAPREISTQAAIRGAVALGAIAGLALLGLAAGVAGSSYVTYGARLLVPAAVCLVAVAVRDRSRPLAIAAGLFLAVTLALLVPVGSRVFLLPLLGGILVFSYVHRGKRPSPVVLLSLTVAALFVSYAAIVVRDDHARSHLGSEAAKLARRPTLVFDPILRRADADMAPALAGALTVVPEELGYRYGRATLGELFIRPLPRELWHGKPQPSRRQVVEAVWPQLPEHFDPAFSPVLSFFWDFGIPGVLVGMALFGVGCRTLYAWFLRHGREFSAQLIFSVALWYVVVAARNDPVDTVVLASFVVLPLVLIERFAGPVRSPGRPLLAGSRLSER